MEYLLFSSMFIMKNECMDIHFSELGKTTDNSLALHREL
jgi:hypothetical protein